MLKEIDPEEVHNREQGLIKKKFNRQIEQWIVFPLGGKENLNWFGFLVLDCINGYSRKSFWLLVYIANNNWAFVTDHYLSLTRRYAKVSKVLGIDLGTENLYCDGLHIFFTGKIPTAYIRWVCKMSIYLIILVKTWDIQITLTDRFFGEYV